MFVYLPIVKRDASPTNPQLQDGYYEAKLPNISQLSFTVSGDGTQAKDVGFLFKFHPFCPWVAYSFGGDFEPITNGEFSFYAYDSQNNELLASFSCQSFSSHRATCIAYRSMGFVWGNCDEIEGIATRQ
jgi:hypothetical protein